ncbi:MAG: HisA/HisF-related TIM barrel protein [Luteibaculum sp.]
MQIIPAIDIINGKCVRLSQGDYNKKTEYNAAPLEIAKRFEGIGIRRLHLVDLDGAKAKSTQNLRVLEELASQTELVIDFSGGISTDQRVKDAFNAGAQLLAVGSVALKEPELLSAWIMAFGAEKFLLAADCKKERVATHGWLEESKTFIIDFLQDWCERGLKQGFVTDIEKDGMLAGPSFDLYKKIKDEVPDFGLIASGGVRSLSDLERLKELGLSGAIVGQSLKNY